MFFGFFYNLFQPSKKRMTKTNFNTFCTWVLDYEASLQEESVSTDKLNQVMRITYLLLFWNIVQQCLNVHIFLIHCLCSYIFPYICYHLILLLFGEVLNIFIHVLFEDYFRTSSFSFKLDTLTGRVPTILHRKLKLRGYSIISCPQYET